MSRTQMEKVGTELQPGDTFTETSQLQRVEQMHETRFSSISGVRHVFTSSSLSFLVQGKNKSRGSVHNPTHFEEKGEPKRRVGGEPQGNRPFL